MKRGSVNIIKLTIIIILPFILNFNDCMADTRPEVRRMQETADLDRDGKKETIYFTSLGMVEGTNGNTFIIKIGSAVASSTGDNLQGCFFLVDIDTNDCFLEIAVPEEGPSDDYYTQYFRYCCGQIINLGKLPGLGNGWTTKFDGAGIVRTLVRARLLDTWFYWGEFQYNEHTKTFLEIIKQEYQVDRNVTLKEELPLFKEKNMREISFTTKVGEKGRITITDNILWFLFESESGRKGWFPVVRFDNILHVNKRASDVFDGLRHAD